MGNQPNNAAMQPSHLVAHNVLNDFSDSHTDPVAVPQSQGKGSQPNATTIGDGNPKFEALREHQSWKCDACGRPSAISILTSYVGGKPRFRHFCTSCDEQECAARRADPQQTTVLTISSRLLIIVGALLGFLSVIADSIHVEPTGGFGFWQQSGALVCVVLVILGTVVRIGPVCIIGLVGLGLSLLADVIGPVGEAGHGWKEEAAIFFAVLLVVAGLYLARRGRVARNRHDSLSSANPS